MHVSNNILYLVINVLYKIAYYVHCKEIVSNVFSEIIRLNIYCTCLFFFFRKVVIRILGYR